MNRRTFLLPEGPEPETVWSPGELTLIRISRRAMATTFEVALPIDTPNAVAAANDALDVIDETEDCLTIYRDDSEVSRLNAAGHAEKVSLSLFELLERCAGLTSETSGAFDVATGALTHVWGFERREPRVPDPRELAAAMASTGMKYVALDPVCRSVQFRRPGVKLNFGSIGKGFALDLAAERLSTRWGIGSAMLHGGGSSVRAIGAPPTDSRGWAISLKHPWMASESLGTVYLRDRGLGTSAATFQFFEHRGRKLGHILDPRTGWPGTGTASATVTAPTAAEADALSTAAFLLGAEPFSEYAKSKPHLAAAILPESGGPAAILGLTPEQYSSPPTVRTT